MWYFIEMTIIKYQRGSIMRTFRNILFFVLICTLALPFYASAKPNSKEDKQEVTCPQCNEKFEVKKLDQNRKYKSRFKRKGLVKCRNCNHKFKPVPPKKAPAKKAAPQKAAPEADGEE